ncbi:serine hydrolase domain-containing protein [Photobacterium lutimaris]|nr:serine hydrolase [Photobacterium lutimaris]TDR76168.1 CubicO group peptidase (beta-lactamase class C family) [Photobacterium lutimaris]
MQSKQWCRNDSFTMVVFSFALFSSTAFADAQDGLSDEVVTLNQLATDISQPTAIKAPQGNIGQYRTPDSRNDGLLTADMHGMGIDTQRINQLRQDITAGNYGQIDSLLIHHKGKLVSEDYWHDGGIDKPHFMFSITKNMLSNAIGKAIELGYIDSVNDPAIKYLSNIDRKQLAAGSEFITLHDLLSMQSGISISNNHAAHQASITVDNHAALYLTLSDNVVPGQRFKYQGADTDILNHVLFNTTGKDLAAFTEEYFFTPMAIDNAYWEESACGLTKASSGLHMTSRDMLKFGMLVLGEGQFNGKPLLTKGWLDTATTPKTRNGNYGYFWWTQNFRLNGKEINTISARGARGQFIFVNPELDLIVAVTSSNTGQQRRVPLQFVPEYILPAIPPAKESRDDDKYFSTG